MERKGTKIKAVIFDMDGVLINSEPLWKIAEIEVFNSLGLNMQKPDLEETVGLRIDQVVAFWRSRFPWKDKSNEEVVQAIVDRVIFYVKKEGKPMKGVYEILEWLRQNNYKIGIGTSSYQSIMNTVIEQLEISHFFDIVHSAEHEEYGKPHPAVYLTCASKLGVNPNECLVIEDSFNGLLAAKAASMHTIVVPDISNALHPHLGIADKLCDTLEDVLSWFTNLRETENLSSINILPSDLK
jgi:mannitol-1-/sugar-/sorbitol-6-/2-deoxyglucose-6-phosphatase